MGPLNLCKRVLMPKYVVYRVYSSHSVLETSTRLKNYNTKIWECDYAYILYEMSILKECTLLK